MTTGSGNGFISRKHGLMKQFFPNATCSGFVIMTSGMGRIGSLFREYSS
jgi:hypothetical protein